MREVSVIITACLILLLAISILSTRLSNHYLYSTNRFVPLAAKADPVFGSLFDENLGTVISGRGELEEIEAEFPAKRRVGRVAFLGSWLPDEIEVSAFVDGAWIRLATKRTKTDTRRYCDQIFNLDVKTERLRFSFYPLNSDEYYRLKEIVILGKRREPFLIGFKNFFFKHERNLASYFFYPALLGLLFFFSFLPTARRLFPGKGFEVLVIVGVVLFVFFGSVASLLDLCLRTSFFTFTFFLFSFCAAFKALFSLRQFGTPDFYSWSLFFLLLLLNLGYNLFLDYSDAGINQWDVLYDHRIAFHYPYKNYEQDYITPYAVSKVISHRLPFGDSRVKAMMGVNWITDRTPLWSIFLIPFFKLFGERFFIFELVGSFMAALMVLPLINLLEVLFNRKVAIYGTLIFLGTHFLPFFIKFTQLKAIVLFFVFSFLFFCIIANRRGELFFAGLVFSLGYFFHQLTIVYSVGFLYAIYKVSLSRRFKEMVGKTLWLLALPILSAVGWVLIAKRLGPPRALTSYWYAYDYYAIVRAMEEQKPLVIPLNLETFRRLLENKFYNLVGLLVENPNPRIRRTWNLFRNTLVGGVSLTYFPLVILSLLKGVRRRGVIFLFSLGPIALYILLLGFYNDLGLLFYLEGVVPILLALAAESILECGRLLWQMLLFILGLIENIYVSWWRNFYIPPVEIKSFYASSGSMFRCGLILLLSWYLIFIYVFVRFIRDYSCRRELVCMRH